jgi:hypothetical protein
MLQTVGIPVSLLTLFCLGLTGFLFLQAEQPQDRNLLLAILLGEGVFASWVIWSFGRPPQDLELPPIPTPTNRPPVTMSMEPSKPPLPRPEYRHHSPVPTRPASRPSDPLPLSTPLTQREVKLPPLPTLVAPQPGRTASRPSEPTPRPAPARPPRPTIRLDDLLPPAPPPAPVPAPPPPPKPVHEATPKTRPKRPKKFAKFNENSAELPAKITLTELELCANILSLGYYCAASDGPVSSEEDDHLTSWLWCVVDKTTDKDAHAFHAKLSETAQQARMRGKQKLDVVTQLAESIRATGERKLIQAAGELCSEIVSNDDRLEPGEFATLATALKGLGTKKLDPTDIAQELMDNDEEMTEMMDELEIDDDTSVADRERILSVAWSRENARMQAVEEHAKREKMRRRMELIWKIRDLYRELEQHG